MNEIEPQQPSGISRRTVTKAMAWAVPAIAIAAPVPAFAGASQGTLKFTGENCKLPGNAAAPWSNGAVYIFTASNTTANPITIKILSVLRSNGTVANTNVTVIQLTGAGASCTTGSSTFIVPAGQTNIQYALVTGEWPSSANGNLVVDFTVNGQPAPDGTTQSDTLPPLTPAGNCAIGGSCAIGVVRSQCILKATGVPDCVLLP